MSPEQKNTIDFVLKNMQKKYGSGTIYRLGDKPERATIERFSSGILSLDLALGGGYPQGGIVEIFGPEMSGKTMLAIYGGIDVQRRGRAVALLDIEGTFDAEAATNNGLDVDDLIIAYPSTGEQAFETIQDLALSGLVGAIILDSVASALPSGEATADMGQPLPGLHARLFSQCLRRINPVLRQHKCTLFCINQLRQKVGGYGNPETTPGGLALKFYSSIRMDTRRDDYINNKGQYVKSSDEAIGQRVRIKVVKNKYSVPFRKAEVDFYYGLGIDTNSDIIDVAERLELVAHSGAWYSYTALDGTEYKEQGKNKLQMKMAQDDLIKEIRTRAVELMNAGKGIQVDDPTGTETP